MTDSRTRPPVWVPALGALAAAIVILLVAVLPAEHGIDPTGLGKTFGLTDLADPPAAALEPQSQDYRSDRVRFTLEPYDSLEYKFSLYQGSGMVFMWSAGAPLVYDFHSEPEDGPEGFADSFESGTAARQRGTYVAPFTGEHGWYWENRGTEPVILTLTAAGFFKEATTYRDGLAERRTIAVNGIDADKTDADR